MFPGNKWMPVSLAALLFSVASLAIILLLTGQAGAQGAGFSCDQISEQECAALDALYQNSSGDQWLDNSGWLDSSTPCSWYGITCNEAGNHVTELMLANNNLVGTIPAQLENLSELTWLDFGSNNLEGNIPGQLGNLSNLRTLYLAGNKLEGPIPYQLGSLSNLELLYLNRNKLQGSIPSQLGDLEGLQFLYLDGSQLSGTVPGSLCGLNALVTTSLGYNKLNVVESPSCVDQLDPEWKNSQTVPPTSVEAVIPQSAVTENYAIEVSWDPIDYAGDPGYYEVYASTVSGGPYQLAGRTIDKTVSSHTVRGLAAETPHYFVVRTVTNPTDRNQSELTSSDSIEVTGTPSMLSLTSFEAGAVSVPLLVFVVLLLFGLSVLLIVRVMGLQSSDE